MSAHRQGCSFARSARCTCAYLAQWDRSPAYTAPAFAATQPDQVAEIGFPALPVSGSTDARLYILQLEHQGLRDRIKAQQRWNLFLLMVLAAEGVYITGHATGWF
ncbi:MAG TPA: hypothetical protein DEP82_14480 [Arthrobacter bacterium]|nr:hypothetical protein [Arthrobacter sp.]